MTDSVPAYDLRIYTGVYVCAAAGSAAHKPSVVAVCRIESMYVSEETIQLTVSSNLKHTHTHTRSGMQGGGYFTVELIGCVEMRPSHRAGTTAHAW